MLKQFAVTFIGLEVITFAPQCRFAMLFNQSQEVKVAKPNKKKVVSKSTLVLRSGLMCKQLSQRKSLLLSGEPAMTTLRDRSGENDTKPGEVASQAAMQSTASQQGTSFQENKGVGMLEQTADICYLNGKLSLTINDVSAQTDELCAAQGSSTAQASLVSDSHLEMEPGKDRIDEQVPLQPLWCHSNSKYVEPMRLNLDVGQEDVSLRSPFLHRISPFLEFCTVTNKEKEKSEAWWQEDDVGFGSKREQQEVQILKAELPHSFGQYDCVIKCDVAAVNGTKSEEGGCSTDGDDTRDGTKVFPGNIPANEDENMAVSLVVEKAHSKCTDHIDAGAGCEDWDGLHMDKGVGCSREMNETSVGTEIVTKAADVAVSGTETKSVEVLVTKAKDKLLVSKTMDATGAGDEMNVTNVQQEAALSRSCKLRLKIRPAPANSHLCLTPLGLPKAKRLKKTFTMEDVYLNRNYKTPPQNRKYETIFEDPQEQKGRLVLTSRAKKCRSLIFGTNRDRKRRMSRSSWTNNLCRSLPEKANLDSLLSQILDELEMSVTPDLS
uniref:uncharacterized protein isoform X2 n=1 Tax=Myxine glutinosa TaxID=7769 RepID=UPI00358E9D36